mgnify:FL=1
MAEDQGEIKDEQNQTTDNSIRPENKVTELDAVLDASVEITAVLGTTMMPISQVLQLGRGAVVELNRKADDDIEILANGRLIATGEIILIDVTGDGLSMDDLVGVRLNNIVRLTKSETS